MTELATATNLYLLVYPIGRLKELLASRPELAAKVFEFLTQITGDQLRDAGRVYGGALHKMEPGELGRVSARGLVEVVPELAKGLCGRTLFRP